MLKCPRKLTCSATWNRTEINA